MLQPLEAPRWPAAPAFPWWCEIRSGGRAAGPWRWPCPRTGRQTEAITWWAARSVAWFPGARCSAATARGTLLASSPSLSLVVRDLIRLACCWTMAKSLGVEVRGDHHLVGGARGGLVPRSALQCCNRSRYPAGRQPQPLPGGARSDPVGVLLDHGQVPERDGRQGHHLVGDPVRRPGPEGRVIVGRSTLQCCNRSRRSVGRRQDGMKGG